MPIATSLKDLLLIRNANRQYIDSINGNLGSALGFKKATGQPVSSKPAILIFIPRKIDPKWLSGSQVIQKVLQGPNGLECPVDVVEGEDYEETYLWSQDHSKNPDPSNLFLAPWSRLRGLPVLVEEKILLRSRLRGWTAGVMPGCQLAGFDKNGNGYYGTLGCFGRDRDTNSLGFITNHHVADHIGNVLRFPEHGARRIGRVTKMVENVRDEQRLAGLIDEPNAFFRVDCAFAELPPDLPVADIDARMPILNQEDQVQIQQIGEPVSLDLDTMGPVGQKVLSVGRTRSLQRGTIAAFAYEFRDADYASYYTDFLIIGEEEGGFSAPGDSGKLIVTDDQEYRPVALLWGGWQQRLRHGREQEKWSYAIDINFILNQLNVDLEI